MKTKMKTKMKTDDKLVHVIEEQLLRVRKTDETAEKEEEEYTSRSNCYCASRKRCYKTGVDSC